MIKKLVKTLKEDSGVREVWMASLTMAYFDSLSNYEKETGNTNLSHKTIHNISHEAAHNFLKNLCYGNN